MELKMKTSIKVAVLGLLLILSGCKKDEPAPTAVQANPFSGPWKMVFAGSYVGTGNINIGADGKFSLSLLLYDGVSYFTNTISGTVASSGAMSADIYYSGSKIGACSGRFSGTGGSGSYQTVQPSSGTWSATKQ